MPSSCTEKLHHELRVKKEADTSQSQSSPSESAEHASLQDNQSTSTNHFGTSPYHHRFKSVIPIDPSVTVPPPVSSQQQRPTSSPSSLPGSTPSLSTVRGSYFSTQPGSTGIEARSPASKRAPASRSSHGIATANGPPPALITRRSCHGEPWRNPLPADQHDPPSNSLHRSRTNDSGTPTLIRRNSLNAGMDGESKSGTMNGISGGHRPASSHRHPPEQDEDDDTLRTLGDARRKKLSTSTHRAERDNGSEEDRSHSPHEDLFLDLARSESEAGSTLNMNGNSRRDSQLGVPTSRLVRTSRPAGSRPASSGQEIDGQRFDDQRPHWSRSGHFETPPAGRHSSPRDRGYAASAHPLDSGKRRYLHSELSSKPFITPRFRNGNGTTRERSPEIPASYGRRQSLTESTSGRPSRNYKSGGRSYLSGNHYGSSPIADISPNVDPTRTRQSSYLDDTESTLSTTAPSTVWDELDDLKSRIRKLELTGKLPSSSGAAMNGAANDRPHTATTTMTTASISPKNQRANAVSPEASTVKDMDISSLHPLLHSALANAKSWVDPKAYKTLERASSDALTLAAMTNSIKSSSEQNAVNGTSQSFERQLRRKADSMCRSLTELCIALSEEKSSKETSTAASPSRPGSKPDHNIPNNVQTPENGQSLRGSSQEPERSSSRIMSRLEARRSSLLATNTATPPNPQNTYSNSQTNSPIVLHQESSIPAQPSTRTDRASSVLLHRRRTLDSGNINGNSNSNNSPNTNPTGPSPRTTIAAASTSSEQRPSPITRISREYTSQHPLPTLSNAQRSPSVRTSLPSASVRRSYFPATTNSPSTPNSTNIQPGRRRYISAAAGGEERQTPPSASSGLESNAQRLAEARQQRIASLGQYSSGGSRRLRLVEGEMDG